MDIKTDMKEVIDDAIERHNKTKRIMDMSSSFKSINHHIESLEFDLARQKEFRRQMIRLDDAQGTFFRFTF